MNARVDPETTTTCRSASATGTFVIADDSSCSSARLRAVALGLTSQWRCRSNRRNVTSPGLGRHDDPERPGGGGDALLRRARRLLHQNHAGHAVPEREPGRVRLGMVTAAPPPGSGLARGSRARPPRPRRRATRRRQVRTRRCYSGSGRKQSHRGSPREREPLGGDDAALPRARRERGRDGHLPQPAGGAGVAQRHKRSRSAGGRGAPPAPRALAGRPRRSSPVRVASAPPRTERAEGGWRTPRRRRRRGDGVELDVAEVNAVVARDEGPPSPCRTPPAGTSRRRLDLQRRTRATRRVGISAKSDDVRAGLNSRRIVTTCAPARCGSSRAKTRRGL